MNQTFAPNKIKNQKYNFFTLVPLVLIQQFIFFSNLFYLIMALSQFVEVLKVGFLFSYVAPLVVVLMITILKEWIDDYNRYRRDKEANETKYTSIPNQTGWKAREKGN